MRGVRVRSSNALFALCLGTLLALSGCAHTLGYAGKNPGLFECRGKISLTGSGSLMMGAGLGGGSSNAFTVIGDCGDGFRFQQGMPAMMGDPIVPSVAPTQPVPPTVNIPVTIQPMTLAPVPQQ